MGLMYDIVGDLKKAKDAAYKSKSGKYVYVNDYPVLDQHAIDFHKNNDVIVITSNGERYYHGKKMKECDHENS